MYRSLTVALSIMLAPSMCFAANWFVLAENLSISKPVVFFVDKDSVKRDGSIVKFWRWLVWEKNNNQTESDNAKTYITANCKTEQYKIDQFFLFNGENLLMQMPGNDPYQPVLPGSMDESILKKVCAGKFTGKPLKNISINDIQEVLASAKSQN